VENESTKKQKPREKERDFEESSGVAFESFLQSAEAERDQRRERKKKKGRVQITFSLSLFIPLLSLSLSLFRCFAHLLR
jgi:hypothetical protein